MIYIMIFLAGALSPFAAIAFMVGDQTKALTYIGSAILALLVGWWNYEPQDSAKTGEAE